VPVVPVDFRLDVEAGAVGFERIGLRHGGGAEPLDDGDGGAVRAVGGDMHLAYLRELDAVSRVVVLDVPGVPVARLVRRIDPELIAAAGKGFASRGLVHEAQDGAVLADGRLEMLVL